MRLRRSFCAGTVVLGISPFAVSNSSCAKGSLPIVRAFADFSLQLPRSPLRLCVHAACQFGKQRRLPAPGKRSNVVRDREGIDDLFPGQKVSVDHFICSTKGRLLHTFGKEPDKEKYSGGAIFVDHASGYIFVAPQVHLNTHETIAAKEAFESHARDFGVLPQEYISNNGSVFTSGAYRRLYLHTHLTPQVFSPRTYAHEMALKFHSQILPMQ